MLKTTIKKNKQIVFEDSEDSGRSIEVGPEPIKIETVANPV